MNKSSKQFYAVAGVEIPQFTSPGGTLPVSGGCVLKGKSSMPMRSYENKKGITPCLNFDTGGKETIGKSCADCIAPNREIGRDMVDGQWIITKVVCDQRKVHTLPEALRKGKNATTGLEMALKPIVER